MGFPCGKRFTLFVGGAIALIKIINFSCMQALGTLEIPENRNLANSGSTAEMLRPRPKLDPG